MAENIRLNESNSRLLVIKLEQKLFLDNFDIHVETWSELSQVVFNTEQGKYLNFTIAELLTQTWHQIWPPICDEFWVFYESKWSVE